MRSVIVGSDVGATGRRSRGQRYRPVARLADRLASGNRPVTPGGVSSADATKAMASRRVPLSPAKAKIVNAALDLFAEHGVGGTSLQMIADAIGVTKAAVYHQFNTKDTKEEIVVAAAEAELSNVEAAIEAAEAEPTRTRARDVLIIRIVDLAVERRRMESTLLGDPVIMRFFAHHEPFPAGDGSSVPATVFGSTAKRACSASTRRITSTDAPSPLTAPRGTTPSRWTSPRAPR